METFRQMGFAMLESPEEGIMPGALFFKSANKSITNLYSNLEDLFTPQNLPAPTILSNKKLSDKFSGFQNFDLNAEGNISFLKILSSVFSKDQKAQLKLAKGKNILFDIDGFTKDVMGFVELDKFLGDAKLDTSGKNTIDYLKNDDLFVITETIKSKSFKFKDAGNNSGSGSIEAGFKNILDADLSFEVKNENETVLENNSDEPKVIAIKAYQIFYEKAFFSGNTPPTFRLRLAEKIAMVRSEEEPYAQLTDETISLTIKK